MFMGYVSLPQGINLQTCALQKAKNRLASPRVPSEEQPPMSSALWSSNTWGGIYLEDVSS